jgi:hypothetical protein
MHFRDRREVHLGLINRQEFIPIIRAPVESDGLTAAD